MALYSEVQTLVNDLKVGEMVTIPLPDKLKAFRKYLSEIGSKDYKKFTTKVKDSSLHILRVKYYSVSQKIQNNG